MSDHKIFTRYKANEIRAELQSFEVKKSKVSANKRKDGLKKIIANLTLGNYNEMAYLAPEILKFWKIEDDLEVKRICHEYVRSFGIVNPKNTVEALPFILNDLKNRNEKIQIMALKTLVAVPSAEFIDEASRIIPSFVNRRSVPPDVTRTAIYALKRLDEVNHDRVVECLPFLLELIQRENVDPIIHVAALNTLNSIHESNPNLQPLKLSMETAFNSLDLLQTLNEWDKALVLDALTISAVPGSHEDAYEMIDIVLPQLQHVNTFVALNAFKFIAYLLNYVDSVNESLIKRFSNSIISLLNKPPELQFLVLRNVILLLLSRDVPLLNLDVSYFFIEFTDPIFIKDTKLECLYLLANEETLPRILEELEQYATDIDIQMSRKAIRAIGNLAVKLKHHSASECVTALLDLLEFGVEYVVQEIISVFRNILRKHPSEFKSCIKDLVKYTDSVQEPESKNAMIWIITNYSDNMSNYLQIFQIFSSKFLEETLDVQFSILNSSVKFFVRDPNPKTEKICMQMLKSCTEDSNNPDLRNRAFMYWSLLSLAQTDKAHLLSNESLKNILDGELPVIELNTKLDPVILEELELNIGTIASIYLKPVSQIFRNTRPRYLLPSPALNKSRGQLKILHDTKNWNNLESLDTLHEDFSNNRSDKSAHKKSMMNDYDKPAETVNQLKGKRKSSSTSPSKLSRKPSMLVRKLSIRKPFS
ncbi:hypothetical protein HG535_0A05170 [Zygotorulaspora mrakii]|uniref:AP complex subunit beta n=1 Tax=Zygotorulaspora mrakii TaxID=42260 RepID=A0A7H9AWA7_ZYGMR|nr:uncharacterized protein HG535_0A05170 [Zygotorulaspora mrakii]QLG70576.1 hypothetical protein HG535_0A05170 [Zygotorulaspora mrakii]